MKSKVIYRAAKKNDLERLVELENLCFDSDQLDLRRFRYFLSKGHDDFIVQEVDKKLTGYGLLLYRTGTSLCRLYSIAIDPNFQGQGLGEALLLALEERAQKRGSTYLRLEVKATNGAAQRLYEKLDYYRFLIKHEYYEDEQDAICYEKKIQSPGKNSSKLKVPFYQQTTDFTCGPASLMMAMKSLTPSFKFSREQEVQIWREATTIFMTSGHGGCGPHGLTLAAHNRGFKVALFLNTKEHLFINSVRQKEKKDIIKLVQDHFDHQIKKHKIPVLYHKISWRTLEGILEKGGVPLVLISSYRLTETKTPHWVVITGMSEKFIFFNDPYVEDGEGVVTNSDIPVRKDEFEKMAKFGSKQIKSFVALYP